VQRSRSRGAAIRMVYILNASDMVVVERQGILTVKDSMLKHVVSDLG
jgi:hypothetical protein